MFCHSMQCPLYCSNFLELKQSKQSSYLDVYECHAAKGKQTSRCFEAQLKFVNFCIKQQKMSRCMVFNLVFNEDSKMGSAIFVPFVKKTKKSTFVRFSGYYLNIPLSGHSFLNFITLR